MRAATAALIAFALACPAGGPSVSAHSALPAVPSSPFSSLPLTFEPNDGQLTRAVRFLARAPGYTLFLTSKGAVMETQSGAGAAPSIVRMRYLGARHARRIAGIRRQPARVNYFLGRTRRDWHVNIPTYAQVEYRDLYPGIDLVFGGSAAGPEYDWIVHPGADLARVALSVQGAGRLHVDGQGNLAGAAGVLQRAPVLYQTVRGRRHRVSGGFSVVSGTTVKLTAGNFDHARPLVVDPTLAYSSRVGGGNGEGGYSLAIDRSGNTYVTGDTSSANFPVVDPVDPSLHTSASCLHMLMPTCVDAFVLKLSAGGGKLIFSTYIGGQGDDYGHGVALDKSGDIYVAGSTTSPDFPSVHARQPQFAGGSGSGDAYILELNPDGNHILFSTYLGGSGNDDAEAIRVSGGSLYLAGSTSSTNFPTAHAWQTSLGGRSDAFLARLTRAGATVYSTYIGGKGTDGALGIAVKAGKVFVAGETGSVNFPTIHSLQAFGGGSCPNDPQNICEDAFVTAFPIGGGKPLYSTLLGGSQEDRADAIAADRSGNAYVVGGTYSRAFPLVRPLEKTLAAYDQNGFVAKISPTGKALLFSTFLGGTSADEAYGVAVDPAGNIFVTGTTVSDDFPTQDAIQPKIASSGPEDLYSVQSAFVTVLAPSGGSLLYSTYLGGVGQDLGADIVTDGKGNAYVTGFMTSKNFPRTPGAFHSSGGLFDAFIAKIHSASIDRADKAARARLKRPEKSSSRT